MNNAMQFIAPAVIMLGVFTLMSIGLIVKGRVMRRGCGGGEDREECMLCDREDKPESCPN